jgi:SAM-dependent MidA family methyltransferase
MDDSFTKKLVGGGKADLGDEILIEKIRERIRAKGRITFAEFMETALYDPERGYYTSGRTTVGTTGDFLTSPSMHPAFGGTIAAWIRSRWTAMNSPESFDVIELGAGKGCLCASILSRIRDEMPDLYSSLKYRIVESSEFCPDFDLPEDKVCTVESLEEIPDSSVTGCFISNELIDAFPVHLVTTENESLREIYVVCRGEEFAEEADEPSTPEIQRYFDRLGISLPNGYRTEVNLQALDWMRCVSRKLREGFVLTVDYGYLADAYYDPKRRRGTLLCYYRHSCSEDFYHRIGRQDITAHVEWSSLIGAGAEVGLKIADLTTQGEFLTAFGIRSLLRSPSDRRIAQVLLDPAGMGGFGVLIQERTAAR